MHIAAMITGIAEQARLDLHVEYHSHCTSLCLSLCPCPRKGAGGEEVLSPPDSLAQSNLSQQPLAAVIQTPPPPHASYRIKMRLHGHKEIWVRALETKQKIFSDMSAFHCSRPEVWVVDTPSATPEGLSEFRLRDPGGGGSRAGNDPPTHPPTLQPTHQLPPPVIYLCSVGPH